MRDLLLFARQSSLKQSAFVLLLMGAASLFCQPVSAAPATQPAAAQNTATDGAAGTVPAMLPAHAVPGTVEGRTVQIRPAIDSAIQAVNCHDGQSVKRGDLLFQLDDASARAQVEAAKAEYELAAARARTYETAGPGIVSPVEKNVVMAQRQVAAATLVVKEAALDQTRLLAPLSGVITHCDATPGEVAVRGLPLATIVQVQPLRVRFSVAEGSDALHVGELVGIYQRNTRERLTVAKVSFISPEDDPATATETIVAEIDNADGKLKPGMTVMVGLPGQGGDAASK